MSTRLAVLALLMAAPLAAQSTTINSSTWTQRFYGCDGSRSCHNVVITVGPHPVYSNYQSFTVWWRGRFTSPGFLNGLSTFPWSGERDILGYNHWYARYHEETSETPETAYFFDWRPTKVFLGLRYGPIGVLPGHTDDEISGVAVLTPVPEPASMMLLASGLALVGGAAHRRRRRSASSEEVRS